MTLQQPGNSETNGPQQQSTQPPQQTFYGVELNEMIMQRSNRVCTEISSLFGKGFRQDSEWYHGG